MEALPRSFTFSFGVAGSTSLIVKSLLLRASSNKPHLRLPLIPHLALLIAFFFLGW